MHFFERRSKFGVNVGLRLVTNSKRCAHDRSTHRCPMRGQRVAQTGCRDACIDKASASPARNGDANHGWLPGNPRERIMNRSAGRTQPGFFGSSPVRGADQGRGSLSSVTSNAKGGRIAEAAENACAIGSVSLEVHPYILTTNRDKTKFLIPRLGRSAFLVFGEAVGTLARLRRRAERRISRGTSPRQTTARAHTSSDSNLRRYIGLRAPGWSQLARATFR
ncbi:hypothetical protein QFZ91_001160 [Paraburkholderia sp. JPY419]